MEELTIWLADSIAYERATFCLFFIVAGGQRPKVTRSPTQRNATAGQPPERSRGVKKKTGNPKTPVQVD